MASVSAYNIIWVLVLALFVALLLWRCVRRQQILQYQRDIYANQPGVQMMQMQPGSIPSPPPGYSAVLVNGQVVFQPLYSAQPAYPHPLYSPASGTYAASPPQGHAVVAIPVQFYDETASYRLSDAPGALPSLRSAESPAAFAHPAPSAPPPPAVAEEGRPALQPQYRSAEQHTGEADHEYV